MPENENIETQVVDNTTDYITAINELKANSVDKSKYEALLNENKKLINNKQLSLKEEIEVLDYFCLQKKININSVKDYLDTKQYDPKIYDININ